jgi:hypothetical protein
MLIFLTVGEEEEVEEEVEVEVEEGGGLEDNAEGLPCTRSKE